MKLSMDGPLYFSEKLKILPHHPDDRLDILGRSVVSLLPYALRRHNVEVLYDPSEKKRQITKLILTLIKSRKECVESNLSLQGPC